MNTVILGGAGKTGGHVIRQLTSLDLPTRPASRSTSPRFDWAAPATWADALEGCSAAYLTFQPDLGLPGAAETIGAFAEQAVEAGVRRLVLLSGRGEEGARRSEQALQASGADWTVLRSAFFMQNFTESDWAHEIGADQLTMVCHQVGEPFVDAADVAAVAVEALTDASHVGATYELTGPRLLTFRDVAAEIGSALGRRIDYAEMDTDHYRDHLRAAGIPAGTAAGMAALFTEVLDGRNAHLTTDVERVLGRRPRDFADFVAESVTATEAWHG